ncbi:MAG: hypothetical protein MUQ32_03915 [Chloroflexi bacterium]|nr:hypothetical protein [Chloroflexota bacterium]
MSNARRTLVALAAAAIALVIVAWFDNTVMGDAQQQARSSGPSYLAMIVLLGSLLVAGSVLLLGVLAWRSASVVVGLAYVVVGGFFAAQLWIWWNLAAGGNEVLPEALAQALRNLFYWSTGGSSLNDVGTIGAGMLIAGIATLARWWRGRAVAAGRVEVMDPGADPTLP